MGVPMKPIDFQRLDETSGIRCFYIQFECDDNVITGVR